MCLMKHTFALYIFPQIFEKLSQKYYSVKMSMFTEALRMSTAVMSVQTTKLNTATWPFLIFDMLHVGNSDVMTGGGGGGLIYSDMRHCHLLFSTGDRVIFLSNANYFL